MENSKCLYCRRSFIPRRNPNQKYCSNHKCQLYRKYKWRREKLNKDADYKVNQYQANKRWQERHPDYWRSYRQSHPGYTQRNRERQRVKKRSLFAKSEMRREFAKSDALSAISSIKTGTYLITPVKESEFAKSDALLVKIVAFTEGYEGAVTVCKETTL